MKKNWLFLSFILIMGLLSSSLVKADIIMPGTHTVYHEIEVLNLGDFPNYTFFYIVCGAGDIDCKGLSDVIRQPVRLNKFNQVNQINFYKHSLGKTFALKNEYFNESLNLSNSNVFIDFIDMNYSFRSISTNVKDEDPLVKYKDVLMIVKTPDGFKFEQKRIVYYYDDGTSEEKTVENGKIPKQSKTLTWKFILLYFGIPLIALIIIIILLLRRKNAE
jgi:hypothetical protein